MAYETTGQLIATKNTLAQTTSALQDCRAAMAQTAKPAQIPAQAGATQPAKPQESCSSLRNKMAAAASEGWKSCSQVNYPMDADREDCRAAANTRNNLAAKYTAMGCQ